MNSFFCNKRYDISFIDFYKLIKLCLPSNYEARDTRGLYKSDYQPCNIIAIRDISTIDKPEEQIYCWLGQKGLTVLADTELTVSLCIEVLKNVQQNPEDYRVLSYSLVDYNKTIDDFLLTEPESFYKNTELVNNYLIYKLINNYLIYKLINNDTNKFLIREYNGDEVEVSFYKDPDSIRLSGAITSLFTYVQLLIEKYLNDKSE